MKKTVLALALIAGTASTFLVMQQKPTQAKAYRYYEPNYMYISNYEIENTTTENTILRIKFKGTFKYYKESPIFDDYMQKNIVLELYTPYENYKPMYSQIELVSLHDIKNDEVEYYNGYYELFKNTKESNEGETTLTIINNNKTNNITYSTEPKRYVLCIDTGIVYLNEQEDKEVINELANITLNNLKIANSKYAQDMVTTYGGIGENYIYKQGYNAGFYAGQLQVNAGSYNEGYAEGFEKGKENGTLIGKIDGYDNGYNEGYNEAMENLDTEYANGYKEGYEKAIKDANVLPDTIFTTVGAVAGFIAQFGKVEILGISLLDIFAMFMIIGVILLITKVVM